MEDRDKSKQIKEMVNSYKLSYLIMTAEELGLFNIINTEPKPKEEIADCLNVKVMKIEPILNALNFYNIISSNNNGYYLEYYKDILNSSCENNQLGYIKFAKGIMEKWENLVVSVKDESIATNNFNELTNKNADDFIRGMNANAIKQAIYISQMYDFTNHKILDIGAGAGTYIKEVVKKYSTANGVAIDLPEMAKILKNIVDNESLSDRIQVKSYDYNVELPNEKFDDIFLFAIAHIENDDSLEKLLKNIYTLLKPKGRLFLTSFFLNEDKISPEFSVMFALEMLVMSKNGKVYTHNEISNHIEQAGFSKITRIDDIPSPATLYIAEK